MKTAYRIPVGKFPSVARFISQETATNTPITEIAVNSLITRPNDGARAKAGHKKADGKSWSEARLGEDLGKYAFRPWSYEFIPKRRGKLSLTARATNQIGQTQTREPIQNPTSRKP